MEKRKDHEIMRVLGHKEIGNSQNSIDSNLETLTSMYGSSIFGPYYQNDTMQGFQKTHKSYISKVLDFVKNEYNKMIKR